MSKIKGFINETLIYGFANVFSRIFAMLLIPLYANFLGKTDYSNLVMLQSFFSILTFLLTLSAGVFYYYYEYENIKYRKMVFSTWFYYQVIIVGIIILTLYFFSTPISSLLLVNSGNIFEIKVCILLIGIQLIPYIFNITNINLFRINRNPKGVMYITLLEAIFTLTIIGIGINFYSFGLVEIMSSLVVARLLVTFFYFKTISFYLNYKFFYLKLFLKLFSFSWPFFIISIFSWLIISVDKFIGVNALENKEDIALLALAMQLTIPITVLADMIRMAIGPFMMSIRFEKDADKSYQQVFDLSVFSSLLVLVGLLIISPFLIPIIANKTYLPVIFVIPLIAFASVLSLIANQFSISFSLAKKTIYIMIATIIGGVIGLIINILFMNEFGFIISGISQLISFLTMCIFLYILGTKTTELNLNLKNSFYLILVSIGYLTIVYVNMEKILNQNYFAIYFYGLITIIILFYLYIKNQKISLKGIFNRS